MAITDNQELVNQILREGFEIPTEKLVAEARLREDLMLDSLDFVDMLVILEEKTNIKVDGEKLLTIKCIGDVYRLVDELSGRANSATAAASIVAAPPAQV